MNLYLDTDGDATNGWAGFDFLINRDRDSFAVTVDRISGTDMQYETVGGAYYAVQGQYMTVRLPKQLLGLSGKVAALNFKWADNSVDPAAEGVKDVMGFMDPGDTAPDDRFTFRYLCEEYTTALERAVTFDTANRAVSLPTAQAVQTGVSYETKLVDRTVNTLFDMERERAGSFIDSTSLAAYFQHGIGTSTSRADIQGKIGEFPAADRLLGRAYMERRQGKLRAVCAVAHGGHREQRRIHPRRDARQALAQKPGELQCQYVLQLL